jgi:hypothetical protein
MPIPSDEKSRYFDFALHLTRELESIAIPPDTLLWHYTNGSALIKILDSSEIFSTHISCLNDASELLYGAKLFREALTAIRPTVENDRTSLALVDGAVDYFKENPDFPAQAVVPHFVACFSEERDDLSQWRAYGGGENGYAIGFKVGDLWGCPSSMVARINYDARKHQTLARKAAEAMVRLCTDTIGRCTPPDLTKFSQEFFVEWERAITMVAPLIKDPGFSKERECRIVKGLAAADLEMLKFIQRGSLMSRHLPLRPPGRVTADPYRLPISEVMVGPCRHPQISRTSVDTLLRQKGYAQNMVSISKIPFQMP